MVLEMETIESLYLYLTSDVSLIRNVHSKRHVFADLEQQLIHIRNRNCNIAQIRRKLPFEIVLPETVYEIDVWGRNDMYLSRYGVNFLYMSDACRACLDNEYSHYLSVAEVTAIIKCRINELKKMGIRRRDVNVERYHLHSKKQPNFGSYDNRIGEFVIGYYSKFDEEYTNPIQCADINDDGSFDENAAMNDYDSDN